MNSCYMEDGPPVMVARWKDRRVCTFVSSVQGGALDHVQRIVDSKGNREAINTYAFVKPYNQYMGGTDTQDRLRLGSGAERVRRAWYKLFLGLLDTAVTNTSIVYKGLLLQMEHSEDVSIPSRHQMIEKLLSLLEKHIQEVKARDLDETEDELDEDGVLRSGVIRRDKLCDGMLEQVNASGWCHDQQAGGKRRGKHPSHCVLCRRAGHRKRSSFYCSKCRLVLCRYPCFENHQYLNVRASGRFKRRRKIRLFSECCGIGRINTPGFALVLPDSEDKFELARQTTLRQLKFSELDCSRVDHEAKVKLTECSVLEEFALTRRRPSATEGDLVQLPLYFTKCSALRLVDTSTGGSGPQPVAITLSGVRNAVVLKTGAGDFALTVKSSNVFVVRMQSPEPDTAGQVQLDFSDCCLLAHVVWYGLQVATSNVTATFGKVDLLKEVAWPDLRLAQGSFSLTATLAGRQKNNDLNEY
eukprot:g72269.t1